VAPSVAPRVTVREYRKLEAGDAFPSVDVYGRICEGDRLARLVPVASAPPGPAQVAEPNVQRYAPSPTDCFLVQRPDAAVTLSAS
jgi:hypothetical protein